MGFYPPKTLTEDAGRGAARSEEMFDVRPLQTPWKGDFTN